MAGLLGCTVLVGGLLTHLPPGFAVRCLAWALTLVVTGASERLCASEPAGVRMLVLIGALLLGMKAVIGVEDRASGHPPLSMLAWLAFATAWPGMRPRVFAGLGRGQGDGKGGLELLGQGAHRFGAGAVLFGLAWFVWHQGRPFLEDLPARILATVLVLPGLSLMLHFGAFNVLAGLWRLLGADTRPLFRAPVAARSLADFWGKRWNLAFSEMTALGVYRPLAGWAGRGTATLAAFVFSGLLHELAISVPVLAGFGLPLTYFTLHAGLVLLEKRLERLGQPVTDWGWWAHVWVIGWLTLPLPVLFHPPFLRGVVWPLLGIC